ncbi:MAG: NAD(P)H-hydrate dehydratase [Bacteroidales bacterium]
MKVFTCNQIKSIDAYTIKHEPIPSVDLMERAANSLLKWIVARYSSRTPFFIFSGPGNNGGDGTALARLMSEIGYNVKLFLLDAKSYSPDHSTNITRLEKQGYILPVYIKNLSDLPSIPANSVIIDSLFGSGLTRPLSGLAVNIVKHINASNAHIIAVDIPSGLFGEDNPLSNNNPVVRAEVTLTLQFPKLSFFFPENHCYVGTWFALDIGLHPKAIDETPTPYFFIEKELVSKLRRHPNKFDHKGTKGRCLIISGSQGMLGAAVLNASSCLKTGAGLLTVHVPGLGRNVIHQSVPEALVQADDNDTCFTSVSNLSKYSAVAVGSGLGQNDETIKGFSALITGIKSPLVVDADGLNILAKSPELLNKLPEDTIITPHIGEFKRLLGESKNGYYRLKLAIEKAVQYKIVIVLKGAHTKVVTPEGYVYINNTGNPGMATAGAGDVLTGMLVSLLGQGYSPVDASILGVYLHGLAGDLAAQQMGEESINATDIIEGIGKAFRGF